MSPERPYFIDDILEAVREGRAGAETALAWLQLRADEAAREARQVRAMWDRPAIRGIGEMSDQEADRLLPPKTPEQFEVRARERDIRASRVADLSDADLYNLLFGQEGE